MHHSCATGDDKPYEVFVEGKDGVLKDPKQYIADVMQRVQMEQTQSGYHHKSITIQCTNESTNHHKSNCHQMQRTSMDSHPPSMPVNLVAELICKTSKPRQNNIQL
eukprot:274816_1